MKSRVKWIFGGCGVICLLVVLAIAAMARTFTVFSAHRDYAQAAQEYRDAGLPWTIDELLGPAISDDENAAAQILQIMDEGNAGEVPGAPLMSKIGTGPTFPAIKTLINPSNVEAIRKRLTARQESLDKLAAIRQLKCRWKSDLHLGPGALFPETSFIKEAVKDLALRAEVKAIEGDGQGSVADLNACVRLSLCLERGPTVIHVLAAQAAKSIVSAAILKCATQRPEDVSYITDLLTISNALADRVELRHCLKGEAFLLLVALRNWDNTPPALGFLRRMNRPVRAQDADVEGLFNRSYAVSFFRERAATYRLIGAGQEEDWDALRAGAPPYVKDVNDALFESDHEAWQSRELPKMLSSDYFARTTRLDYESLLVALTQSQCRALSTSTALKLARWKLIGDGSPLPALPGDPFGEGTLKHSVKASGVKVWSVGRDRRDNGGDPQGDIVSELPWKPRPESSPASPKTNQP